MLLANMPAQDICGFLFRPNRSLNPAGVYEIKAGKRGSNIPPHSPAQLADWLHNHPYFGTIATADLVSDLRKELRGILRAKKDGDSIRVDPKETSQIEFKETFHLRSFPEYCRSLIGYGNHRGGYLVFGISDDRSVVGLQNQVFKNLDPKKVSELIKDLVTPTVRWVSFVMNIHDREIGVLFAEEAELKPLITIKNADKIKENVIYFRYEAETAMIRAGDLQAIIRKREHDAVQNAISKLQQIAGIGLDNAEIADSSRMNGGDEVLSGGREAVVKKSGISDLDILLDFVNGVEALDPVAYLLQSAHEPVRWLPIFYYAKKSGMSAQAIVDEISNSPTSKPGTINHMRQRLTGQIRAYKDYTGAAPKAYLDALLAGDIPNPKDRASARHFAMCLVSAPDNVQIADAVLRTALRRMVELYSKYSNDSAIGSNMRRSAARADEILFG